MASTIINKNIFTNESRVLYEKESTYLENREKIDASIWNDYINDAVTPAPILLKLLEQFRKHWRFEPKRHKILDDFF